MSRISVCMYANGVKTGGGGGILVILGTIISQELKTPTSFFRFKYIICDTGRPLEHLHSPFFGLNMQKLYLFISYYLSFVYK